MFFIQQSNNSIPLTPRELILIGRGEMCDVQLNDPSASRVHCRLLSKRGKVFLTDAGSRWGTFVNGKRVDEAELGVGDVITIGETVFTLSAEHGPRASTLAPKCSQPLDLVVADAVAPEIHVAANHIPPIKVDAAPFVPARFLQRPFLRYRIDSLIAHTRSGMLFQATDPVLDRVVAIKIFRSDHLSDATEKQRFLRAVRTMIDFRHPYIVQLFDAGEHEGHCYTISEMIEGISAAGLIEKIGVAGMLDWRTVANIGIDICEALTEIHEQGVVHRNIKPEHILIRNSDKRALLGEVTLAKAWNKTHVEQITMGDDVAGDLMWQSPEQLGCGEPVDQRSDLFQLGMALYTLLTGKHPFAATNALQVTGNIMEGTPPALKSVHLAIPDLLEDAVQKLLAKHPAQRFVNAVSARQALEKPLRYGL